MPIQDIIILIGFYFIFAFILSGGIDVMPEYQKHAKLITFLVSLTWPAWILVGIYNILKQKDK